ncbi:MAG: glycosyltransferase family 4 protein [Candidatus Korarchaeota archaeon]|nr:glycosyltransferase family 4 protein [Candidatus Korarchaeota archaeon]
MARVAISETEMLRREGFNASIASIVRSRDEWPLFEERGIKPLYFFGDEIFGRIFHGILPFQRMNLLDRYRYLILHNLPSAIIIRRHKALTRSIKILYLHDPHSYSLTGSILGYILSSNKALMMRAEKDILKRIDMVLVNSISSLNKLKQIHCRGILSKVRVLYPTVNVPLDRREIRTEREGYIIILGRIDHEAFINLAKIARLVKWKIVIAGYGNKMNPNFRRILELYRDLIKRGREVRVVLSPSDREVTNLLKNANLFVYPGHENFNMSAMESMSVGTPVLVADTSGVCELMPFDLRESLCLPKHSTSMWVERINEIMRGDPLSLGMKCWEVTRRYNLSSHMNEMLSIINRLGDRHA